jgi:cyclophilin family peptidyl-prolyl cis-trans isomerase
MTDDRRRPGSTGAKKGGPSDGPVPTFDLYAVLNVRPDATAQEIREAVATMDGRLHAAAARQRGGSTARQKRFNIARHWLLDGDRRRRYDAERARAATAVTSGRVQAGSATRGSSGTGWLRNPLTWAGAVVVVVIVAFLVLRPGGLGGSGASASASAAPSASAGASEVAVASGGAPSPRTSNPPGCPTSQPPAGAAGQKELVTIETDLGSMAITVENDLSPIAAGNFVALADCGYYDGVVFHRVASLPDGTPFVIQGGDPTGTGSGGPGYSIQDEPVKTPYKRGTVAMARTSAPNSVGSQFFVVLDDKDGAVLSSANTYQIIGSVTSGMDTADKIYAAAGGVELPTNPVVMRKVTVGTP